MSLVSGAAVDAAALPIRLSERNVTLPDLREFVSFASLAACQGRARLGGDFAILRRCAGRLWGVALAAGLLPSASAQVIGIDGNGVSHTYCTAGQNRVAAHHTERSSMPSAYKASFQQAAQRYAISIDLLDIVARRESNYDPRAISPKGAVGIMQLMPATARAFGVNPYNVEQNIFGGAAYLRYLLDVYQGRIDLVLSAYNAGQGAITRYGGIPPFKETRTYLLRGLENLAQKSDLQSSGASADLETGYIQNCR